MDPIFIPLDVIVISTVFFFIGCWFGASLVRSGIEASNKNIKQ